jgi:hypothetical protein
MPWAMPAGKQVPGNASFLLVSITSASGENCRTTKCDTAHLADFGCVATSCLSELLTHHFLALKCPFCLAGLLLWAMAIIPHSAFTTEQPHAPTPQLSVTTVTLPCKALIRAPYLGRLLGGLIPRTSTEMTALTRRATKLQLTTTLASLVSSVRL